MVATAIIAGAAVAGAYSSYKGAKAQKAAIRSNQRAEKVRANRSRRQAFREAQIARARAMVMAGGAGTGMSSGAAGGIGSLSSQLGANLGFSTQVGAINRETSAFEQSAMKWQGLGALASGFGQAAGAYRDYKWNKAGGTVNNGLSGPGE